MGNHTAMIQDAADRQSAAADAEFVRAHTRPGAVPFVPEVRLQMAEDAIALWEVTERARGEEGLAPPFWAFPWAGGVAVGRDLLARAAVVAQVPAPPGDRQPAARRG